MYSFCKVRFDRQRVDNINHIKKIQDSTCILAEPLEEIKELKISSAENIDCFLMYDADVQEVVENINKCGARAVFSRPCIEVWFLAHSEKIPNTDFSSDECLSRLIKVSPWKNYKKGALSDSQKNLLWEKRFDAVKNISHVISDEKVFSTINEFLDVLERSR